MVIPWLVNTHARDSSLFHVAGLNSRCNLTTGTLLVWTRLPEASHPCKVLLTEDEGEPAMIWLVSSSPARARKGGALATLLHPSYRSAGADASVSPRHVPLLTVLFDLSPPGGRSLAPPLLTIGGVRGYDKMKTANPDPD